MRLEDLAAIALWALGTAAFTAASAMVLFYAIQLVIVVLVSGLL